MTTYIFWHGQDASYCPRLATPNQYSMACLSSDALRSQRTIGISPPPKSWKFRNTKRSCILSQRKETTDRIDISSSKTYRSHDQTLMEAVLKSLMQSIPDLNAKRRVVHGQEPASIYASKIYICPGEKSLDLARMAVSLLSCI